MRVSELNYDLLTDEDKLNLIMSGITDHMGAYAKEEDICEAIIVLGCSPRPLHSRIRKAVVLYESGYSNAIIISGGPGWQRLMKSDKSKEEIYLDYIKKYYFTHPKFKTYEEMRKYYNSDDFKKNVGELHFPFEELYKMVKLNTDEATIAEKMPVLNPKYGINVYYERMSKTTPENAMYTRELLEKLYLRDSKEIVPEGARIKRTKRLLLITNSFHCRRTFLTFKKYFPDYEIIVNPATKVDGYEMKHVFDEARKIIEYTRNGSIADLELSEFLSPEIASEIEEHQGVKKKTR